MIFLKNDWIYVAVFFLALIIMLLTDFVLGKKAEHLNAWSVLLQTLNIKTNIPPSKAMLKFGLWGAWTIIFLVNSILAFVVVKALRFLLSY